MAYGFLRQVFEVFERFRTAVDVVTTSEVSVSVTVDDRRHLERSSQALKELGDVSVEPEMALLCAVGDRLRDEPAIGARVVAVLEEVPLRMISQAASRRNITVILRQSRSAARHAAAARGVVRMKLLLVGYGKMGRLVEQLALEQGDSIVRTCRHRRPAGGQRADVAIDFYDRRCAAGRTSRGMSS